MASLKITQKRSSIGRPPDQRRTLRALGLRKIGQSVQKPDSPDLRGMLFKVQHLIEVEEGQ
ncbi:MAG: 50S ribosomal protein L30 [Actinomycetota bacterium]